MNSMIREVDEYIGKAERWQKELAALRMIILDCMLTEELKWRVPCYTFQDKNIVIIGELKECCVLSFFKGALLSDPHGILLKPGANTQAARIIRFTDVETILQMEAVLKAYIYEAIEAEKAGLKVNHKNAPPLVIPTELQQKMNEMPTLKAAFKALTPGRQRAYVLYFSGAKQPKTRASRVEKCLKNILEGKGLNDGDVC